MNCWFVHASYAHVQVTYVALEYGMCLQLVFSWDTRQIWLIKVNFTWNFLYFFQIGLKITENKKLKRNLDSLKNEKELLQQDLEHKTRESEDIQSKLDSSNNLQLAKSNQINQLEAENKNLHRDLEKAKLELADNLAKEPILQEQIQVKLKRLPKTTFSIGD